MGRRTLVAELRFKDWMDPCLPLWVVFPSICPLISAVVALSVARVKGPASILVPALWLLAILDLPSHFFSLIAELGNGQLYLSVSSVEESTLFLMHLVSAFPGPFPHTHIVCRAITDLAGELIQEHNLFQTKCTLFPPGQLNWNKSVQKH